MNHGHYGLRPMRRCCADFGNDSNETCWNVHYSLRIDFADISRRLTPPCGNCGSAARSREASALRQTVARGSARSEIRPLSLGQRKADPVEGPYASGLYWHF